VGLRAFSHSSSFGGLSPLHELFCVRYSARGNKRR
jgi:hypothetical protein